MQTIQLQLNEKLNHLCAILEDAHDGYQSAAYYTRSQDLEESFDKLSYERIHFVRDIKKLVAAMGGQVMSRDGFLGLLHRTWKEMSYKIKSGNADTIKNCCVAGEKVAVKYYEALLADDSLPMEFHLLLSSQLNNIKQTLLNYTLEQIPAEVKILSLSSTAVSFAKSSKNKISFIVSFLNRIANDFEMIADEIEDKNLRNAFLSLSEEDKQFAEELNCQLKHFGIAIPTDETSLQWEDTDELFGTDKDNSKTKELLHICDKSEYIFLKLYTEALKEYLSFNKLRDIMVYQYNTIRAGFVKLRMLHSLRMNNQLTLS